MGVGTWDHASVRHQGDLDSDILDMQKRAVCVAIAQPPTVGESIGDTGLCGQINGSIIRVTGQCGAAHSMTKYQARQLSDWLALAANAASDKPAGH